MKSTMSVPIRFLPSKRGPFLHARTRWPKATEQPGSHTGCTSPQPKVSTRCCVASRATSRSPSDTVGPSPPVAVTDRLAGASTTWGGRPSLPNMRMLHLGLRVSDLEQSLACYIALGYAELGRVPETAFGSLTMI